MIAAAAAAATTTGSPQKQPSVSSLAERQKIYCSAMQMRQLLFGIIFVSSVCIMKIHHEFYVMPTLTWTEAEAAMIVPVNTTGAKTNKNKYAYAFLYYVPENEHERDTEDGCELLVALRALQKARQQEQHMSYDIDVDIVVMELPAQQSMDHRTRSIIENEFGAKIIPIQEPYTKGNAKNMAWTRRYIESFAKLRVAELFQYRRIIFLELDYMSLKSLDHFFYDAIAEESNVMRVPYAAPRMYWEGQQGFTQAGPFYVDPYRPFWNRYFQSVLDGEGEHHQERKHGFRHRGIGGGRYDGDNDWTNAQFKGGVSPTLSGFYALLIAEFIPGDGVYDYWGSYYHVTPKEILNMAYGIHFVAGHKPWALQARSTVRNQPQNKELRSLYHKWWSIRDEVCPLKNNKNSSLELQQPHGQQPQKSTSLTDQ